MRCSMIGNREREALACAQIPYIDYVTGDSHSTSAYKIGQMAQKGVLPYSKSGDDTVLAPFRFRQSAAEFLP